MAFGKAWLIMFAPIASGCAANPAKPSACDAHPATLSASLERLIAADNARDVEGVLASYTENVVWLPPAGDAVNGIAAIRPRYERMFIDFEPALGLEVREAFGDGDLGIVRGFTRGRLLPIGGGEPVRIDDKFLSVLQCREGRWLISHLAWSPRHDRE